MTVKSNQYDAFPCKTYYYIEDNGYIWHHSDNRWRKKCLIQLWSYGYQYDRAAEFELSRLISLGCSPRSQEIAEGKLWQVSPDGEPDNVLLEGSTAGMHELYKTTMAWVLQER